MADKNYKNSVHLDAPARQARKRNKVAFFVCFIAILLGVVPVYVFAVKALDFEWWVPLVWIVPIVIIFSLVAAVTIRLASRYGK